MNRKEFRRLLPVFITFFILLFLTGTIRSEFLTDQSYLPRLLALSIIVFAGGWTGHKQRGFTLPAGRRIFTADSLIFLYPSFLILFFLLNLLSSLWSIVPSEAWAESIVIFLCLSVFLMISRFRKQFPDTEKLFISALIPVLILSFALAFYRMSTLQFFDPYRIISICANNNLYAGYLLLSLGALAAGFALMKGFMKYLSAAMGILALFFITVTQSRAAYLGTLSGILLSLILLLARYRHVFTIRNILTALSAALILAAGILIFHHSLDPTRKGYFMHKLRVWDYFINYDTIQEKVIRKQSLHGDELNKIAPFDLSEAYYENANLRMIFWKRSLPLIADNPFTGAGAGQWRLVVPCVTEPANPEHTFKNFTYSQPHNEWIAFLTELGVPGLLLALAVFLLLPVYTLAVAVKGKSPPPVHALMIASFMIGFCLYASFDFPFRRIEHNVLFFSLLTFLPGSGAGIGRISVIRYHYISAIRAIRLVLLCLCLTFLLARIRGEYYTRRMFNNERKNDKEVIRCAQNANGRFYRITPNTMPVVWFEGVARYRIGDVAGALNNFNEAIRYTPCEVRVIHDRSIALWTLGKNQEAIIGLQHAITLDPWFDEARLNLAAIFCTEEAYDSASEYLMPCRDSERKSELIHEINSQTNNKNSGNY